MVQTMKRIKPRRAFIFFTIAIVLVLGVFWYVREIRYLKRTGWLSVASGDPYYAEKIYRLGVKLNPFSEQFQLGLAHSLLLQPNYDEAEKEYLKLYQRMPDSIAVLGGLSDVYLNQGRLDESEELCERILRLNREDPISYLNLAEIYRRRGDYDMALNFGMKAMEFSKHIAFHNPNMTLAGKKTVEILNEKSNYNEAIALMAEMLKYFSDDKMTIFELGKAQEYLHEKDRAHAAWKDFLRITEDDFKKSRAFAKERAFAEERLIEIEKGNFLTPPSPKNRLNWGEIPKSGINTPDRGLGPK